MAAPLFEIATKVEKGEVHAYVLVAVPEEEGLVTISQCQANAQLLPSLAYLQLGIQRQAMSINYAVMELEEMEGEDDKDPTG